MRPMLKPALRRIWRDQTTLQLGVDPELAVVIADLDRPSAQLLESLDGTRDTDGVLARARAIGVEPPRARRLLELLASSGVLDDGSADRRPLTALDPVDRDRLAPDLASLSLGAGRIDGGASGLARRRRAAVVVHGAGRVGASVSSLLAAAGVGHVVVIDREPVRSADTSPGGLTPDTVGTARQDAARTAMRRGAPGVRSDLPPGRPAPDAAVLAPTGPVPQSVVEDLLRDGVPHLPATVRECTGIVGPLVLPGRSACLRCLDLHRTDRDPAWPHVAAQLATTHPVAAAACDVVLATVVAAQAALQILVLLDGTSVPPAVDGTLETNVSDGRTRRRSWRAHHACGCHWGPWPGP